MPRQPRLHSPARLYHVILRGNNRAKLFFSRVDRERWVELIKKALVRYDTRVHAFCWMTNHIHMAVQAGNKPLAGFMGYVAGNYGRYLNKRRGGSGHVFERRYRAILVEADSYLLELVRYIHLNPVRAHMVADPADYEWSSHRVYLNVVECDWLITDLVLATFGPDSGTAKDAYARFMASDDVSDKAEGLLLGREEDSRVLGDDVFMERVLDAESDSAGAPDLDRIIQTFCQRYRVTEADLAGASRQRCYARIRAEIAISATRQGATTLAALARRFNRSESGLARSVRLHLLRRQQK